VRFSAISPLVFAALITAQQKPDIRVDVDLVTVACSVTDHNGAPVKNLKPEDFKVSDNGQPREIRNVWQESDLPLTVALVADVSGSQDGYVKDHKEAITQFLKQVIGQRDRAMIVQVARQAWMLSDLTGSAADLDAAVEKIGEPATKRSHMLGPPCRNARIPHPCGGSALWHGLYYTAMTLKPVTGRKAIVVLSDGLDTGSDISVNDLVDATQSAEAVVYSVKYSSPARFISIGTMVEEKVSHGLERLDHDTGGATFPNPGKKTSEVFARIESDLRGMYVLGFATPENARDGKFHKLDVKVSRNDLVVRSRAGYLALQVP